MCRRPCRAPGSTRLAQGMGKSEAQVLRRVRDRLASAGGELPEPTWVIEGGGDEVVIHQADFLPASFLAPDNRRATAVARLEV